MNVIELLICGVLLAGALRAFVFAIGDGKRGSRLRAVGNLAAGVALIGGVLGLVAQSLMFENRDFSKAKGQVFIPILRDGVYTTQHLAIAWYGGIALLLGGMLAAAIAWALVSAKERKS